MAEVTNSIIRAGHSFRSTTAVSTPSAFSTTEYRAFASTVSGAVLMGYGTTFDVTLKNRAGTDVLGIGPNTTTVTTAGAVVIGTTITNSTGDLDLNSNGANAVRVNRSGGTGGFVVLAGGTTTDNFRVTDAGVGTLRAGLTIGGALAGVTMAGISGLVTTTKTGQFLTNSGATTSNIYVQLANTSGQMFLGIESSAGGSIVTGSTAYDSVITGLTGLVLSGDNGTTVGQRITATGTQFKAGIALSAGTVPSNGIQFGTSAPGSLADGQMWYDGTDFKVRTGGATKTITIA